MAPSPLFGPLAARPWPSPDLSGSVILCPLVWAPLQFSIPGRRKFKIVLLFSFCCIFFFFFAFSLNDIYIKDGIQVMGSIYCCVP
jgi:hypothetical protein